MPEVSPIFSEYQDKGAQRTATLLFLGITLFFAAAFHFIPMPSQEYADRTVEVLMLDKMIFEPLEEAATTDEEESEPDEPEMLEESSQEETETVTEDLEGLMEAFGAFSFSDVGLEDAALTDQTRQSARSALDQEEFDIASEDLSDVFGAPSPEYTLDLQRRESGHERTTRSLRPGLLSEGVSGERRADVGRISGSGGVAGLQNLRGRGQNTEGILRVQRREIKPEDLDAELTSLSTDKLADWIRQNQSPLDPGVRSFFRYLPTDETAKVEISVDGNPYGLQLMHSPGAGDIHIALLDQGEIYYFIDPGSQRRASYFQMGTVRRNDNMLVMMVESEDFSARSPEALRFFGLFLAWWHEVEKGM